MNKMNKIVSNYYNGMLFEIMDYPDEEDGYTFLIDSEFISTFEPNEFIDFGDRGDPSYLLSRIPKHIKEWYPNEIDSFCYDVNEFINQWQF